MSECTKVKEICSGDFTINGLYSNLKQITTRTSLYWTSCAFIKTIYNEIKNMDDIRRDCYNSKKKY